MSKEQPTDGMVYVAQAAIKLYADKKNGTYKTETLVDFDKTSTNEDGTINRDIVLATIAELRSTIKGIVKGMTITQEEFDRFIKDRKLISKHNSVTDSIDKAIDNLFEDES